MIGRYLFRFDTRWVLGNHCSRFTSNLAGHDSTGVWSPVQFVWYPHINFCIKSRSCQIAEEQMRKTHKRVKNYLFLKQYIFSSPIIYIFEFDVIYSSRCMTTVFCIKEVEINLLEWQAAQRDRKVFLIVKKLAMVDVTLVDVTLSFYSWLEKTFKNA